jgi:hypothetical protein
MKTSSGQIGFAVLLSFVIVTFAYAIDRVGSPPPGETTTSPAATIQGELLRIEGGFYTVKDAAGNEVRLLVTKGTDMDRSLRVGDKVEAQSNPSGRATYIKKASLAEKGLDSTPSTLSTPSKLDSGAPGTHVGSGLGTDTGTEKGAKPPSGR